MQAFLAELKRRKVYRVAIAYTAAGWGILQVADILSGLIALPDWTMRAVLLVTAAGFPLALFLAWAFDITDKGVVPTPEITVEEQRKQRKQALPVAQLVLTILLVVGVGFLFYDRLSEENGSADTFTPPPVEMRSIAVLPFSNMSTDPGNRYFSDGISEELLNSLANIEGLQVAARTSSFHFRDTKDSVIEIGAKLAVATLLEGSVRKAGERVRVTAQLIDTKDGFHLWSEVYDADLENIFEVQADISRRVVGAILPMIMQGDAAPVAGPGTTNGQAYNHYLIGRAQLRGVLDDEALGEAMAQFEQARLLDPGYAEAFAGICQVQLEWYRRYRDTTAFDEAHAACQVALEKSPRGSTSWDVHIALGVLFREAGDGSMSLRSLEKARKYRPELVATLQQMGLTYAGMGELVKAEGVLHEAIALEGTNWSSYLVLGNVLHDEEDYQRALEQYDKVLEIIPDSVDALIGQGSALNNLGLIDRAEVRMLKALELARERDRSALGLIYTNLGLLYYHSERYADALQMHQKASEIMSENHRVWGRIAESYRALGDRENELAAYTVAIDLAGNELERNPSNWETLGLLGKYNGFSGDTEAARDYTERMLELTNLPGTAHFFAALSYAASGWDDLAFKQLEAAIRAGFPADFLTKEPDLRALRETDPARFDAL